MYDLRSLQRLWQSRLTRCNKGAPIPRSTPHCANGQSLSQIMVRFAGKWTNYARLTNNRTTRRRRTHPSCRGRRIVRTYRCLLSGRPVANRELAFEAMTSAARSSWAWRDSRVSPGKLRKPRISGPFKRSTFHVWNYRTHSQQDKFMRTMVGAE
jgi:hypothetical protein